MRGGGGGGGGGRCEKERITQGLVGEKQQNLRWEMPFRICRNAASDDDGMPTTDITANDTKDLFRENGIVAN